MPQYEATGSGQSDLGFERRLNAKQTIMGKMRPLQNINKMEYAFLFLSIASVLATIGFCIYRIVDISTKSDPTTEDKADRIFAIALIVNSVICLYYILHGILCERPYELVVYIAAVVIVIVYLIMNIATSPSKERLIQKAPRLGVAAILGILTILMGAWLSKKYHDEGRLIFYSVGASNILQKGCKLLFANEALMKLDLELQLTILILGANQTMNKFHIATLAIGFPFSILCLLFGFLMLRYENKIGCYIYLILSFLVPAYIIFRIVRLANYSAANHTSEYLVNYACLSAGLLCHLLLFITSILCMRNFNQGLKERVVPNFPKILRPSNVTYAEVTT